MPRPVRLSGGGAALIALSVLLIVGGVATGILLARSAGRKQAEARRMLAEGRDIEGVVTRLWRTGGDPDEYHVAYQFTTGGFLYSSEATIDNGHWERLREGSRIWIRYLPSSPVYNYPGADPPRPMPAWMGILFGGILLLTGALLPGVVRRRHRLLATGIAARAVVIGIRTVKDPENGARTYVDYEFRIEGGGTLQGSYRADGVPPCEGSGLCVLYDPDNPPHNATYPIGLVKLAGY